MWMALVSPMAAQENTSGLLQLPLMNLLHVSQEVPVPVLEAVEQVLEFLPLWVMTTFVTLGVKIIISYSSMVLTLCGMVLVVGL